MLDTDALLQQVRDAWTRTFGTVLNVFLAGPFHGERDDYFVLDLGGERVFATTNGQFEDHSGLTIDLTRRGKTD